MLALRTSKDLVWLDVIEPGVRVKVPPLDVAGLRSAEYRAMKAAGEAKATAGIPDDEPATDAQIGVMEGAFTQARIRALADRIVEWEGVVSEDGTALPISPDALDAFASHPQAGLAFLRAYERPVQAVVAEGNVSAPSSAGDSVEGSTTAEGALTDVASAQASSTPRKPKRDRPVKPR
jgi:hypothetical protein